MPFLANRTVPSPYSTFTPPVCRLLGGMVDFPTTKNPHDRPFGGEMCWYRCWWLIHGEPMNSGNWFDRLLMSTPRQVVCAAFESAGSLGLKNTSATGLTIA